MNHGKYVVSGLSTNNLEKKLYLYVNATNIMDFQFAWVNDPSKAVSADDKSALTKLIKATEVLAMRYGGLYAEVDKRSVCVEKF